MRPPPAVQHGGRWVAAHAVITTYLEWLFGSERYLARDRLRPAGGSALAPSVAVRPEASQRSTVLEVRATDKPGVLYLVLAALARLGITVRSAHIDTLGPQAVDVFYLQESDAGALSEDRGAEAAHAVRAALNPE